MTSWVAQETINSQARFQLPCIFQGWRGLVHKMKVWAKHGEDQREQGSGSHQQWPILLHQAILLHAPESCCKTAVVPLASSLPWQLEAPVSTLLHNPHSWLQLLPERKAEWLLLPDVSTLTTATGAGEPGMCSFWLDEDVVRSPWNTPAKAPSHLNDAGLCHTGYQTHFTES